MHHARRLLPALLFALMTLVPITEASAAPHGTVGPVQVCVRGETQHARVVGARTVTGNRHAQMALQPRTEGEPIDVMIVVEGIFAGLY